ncbi:MAG: DUF2283 domain-containing protein [Candidatus Baldrarchaeia archaeon]
MDKMVKKIIEYDVKADVLTINLIEDFKVVEDKLLDNDVVVSFDENGKVVQIQVLDASKKGLTEILINLSKSKKYLLSKLTEQNK